MRLELRVTLWLAVLLGAATILTLVAMGRFETQSLERQSQETGRLLALATENSLEVSMLNNAPDDIRRTVRNVEEGALIASVSVFGRDGSVWVSSDGPPAMAPERHRALLRAMDSDRPATSSGDGLLSVFVPVANQPACVGCHTGAGTVLGAVEVRMDERPFQQGLARSARSSLYFAAIPLLLGLLASVWAVRRSLLKPLAQVGEAAAQLGGGDLSVRLPPLKGWEFSSVATTFNDMAGRLETQAADLLGTVERLRSDLEGMEELQALLASGAGLKVVLARAAGNLGSALEASGVGIWTSGADTPEAVWGTRLPPVAAVVTSEAIATSAGALHDVPEDAGIGWAVAPAHRGGRTLAVVGVAWDPPRPLGRAHRDLLASLAGLVAVAAENADLLERLRKKEESLQGLLRKTLVAQEEERRRISRELHDETSQVLSALMMNIDLLETQIRAPAPFRARVEAVKALAEEAARNLDKMMLDLRPALLDELGLIAALRWYAAQVTEVWGLPVEFAAERTGRLPEHVEVAAFRIVQEAVNNAVRHSQAGRIRVRVTTAEGSLRVEVEDDGVGFDFAEVSARARTGEAVGLEGMRERAELAGGVLNVESGPGRGTKVTAEIPLEHELGESRWAVG